MILKALLVGSSPNEFSSTSLQDLDILFPDLVYDYYAAAWDGPQGRLEVFAMIIMMMMVIILIMMITIRML